MWHNRGVGARIDLDELLVRGLTALLLAGYVAIVYVLVVAAGGLPEQGPHQDFAPPWWSNLLAFVLIAVTFLPVYRWLRGGVYEMIYSPPENPYPVLAGINQQFSAGAPQAILPAIVSSMAQMLKLPYVEIVATGAEANPEQAGLRAAFGSPPPGAAVERLALIWSGETIGELRVAAPRRRGTLSDAERAILHDLAPQVGIVLFAAQLSDDLQRVRQRLVIAREEERRRIRNDLHDGLAPTLSALQLQLGAARNLLQRDPPAAEALLEELRQDLRAATAEIRQLVYDLRPPRLDELGLVGALRSLKLPAALVCYEVRAPEPLPALSAALEVALYRIASEAVHNVVRHAGATECVVTLEAADGRLRLCVSDDGSGLPPDAQAGVGLASMAERAAELGGTLSVQACPEGGVCLSAVFPLAG